MASLGAQPPLPLLEDASATDDSFSDVQPREVVVSATTEKMVAAIVSQLDRTTQGAFLLFGFWATRDRDIAREAADVAKMDDETKDQLAPAGAYMWEKYIGKVADPREAGFWVLAIGYLLKVGGAVGVLVKAKQELKASQ